MSDLTLDQAQSQIKGLTAQLEAAKQVVNESLQTSLQLRTNLILYQQAHQELAQENNKLKDLVAPPISENDAIPAE